MDFKTSLENLFNTGVEGISKDYTFGVLKTSFLNGLEDQTWERV